MAQKSKSVEDFPVELLSGGKPVAEKLVRRGMLDLERELTKQFNEERDLEVEATGHMSQVRDALLTKAISTDQMATGVRGLRALDYRLSKAKLNLPKIPSQKRSIRTGSIVANVVPPFTYQWTWSATSGNPSLSLAANRTTGQMSFNIWNASRDASGSARAAIGIYFRPVTESGFLRLWSNPAFNYSWWTYCAFASAHSDAFIGLYVGRYTLAGGYDATLISQQINLWNDDSWWSGAGSHNGSNSGYPLFSQFNVDRSHWYALWVWCGGRASAVGWDSPFWGSGAASNLAVTIPSMTWELF
jgi:hypothetical protein